MFAEGHLHYGIPCLQKGILLHDTQSSKVCDIGRQSPNTDSVKQRRTEGNPMIMWMRKANRVMPFLLYRVYLYKLRCISVAVRNISERRKEYNLVLTKYVLV
jgi:hypothetical protein